MKLLKMLHISLIRFEDKLIPGVNFKISLDRLDGKWYISNGSGGRLATLFLTFCLKLIH